MEIDLTQPLLDVKNLRTRLPTQRGVVHVVNGGSRLIREDELVGANDRLPGAVRVPQPWHANPEPVS